jgi:hypothetical protein
MSRALFLAGLFAAAPALADAGYFSTIDDLPIAPGLVETGGGAGFEGPGGAVVVAFAAGQAAPGAVRGFYGDTLGALGWAPSPGEDLVFLRGRERLTLGISAREDGVQLTARLVRRPPPIHAD